MTASHFSVDSILKKKSEGEGEKIIKKKHTADHKFISLVTAIIKMSWYFPTPASFHCGWFAARDNMLTEGLYAAAATFVAFSVRGPHGSRGVGHAAMFTRRQAV